MKLKSILLIVFFFNVQLVLAEDMQPSISYTALSDSAKAAGQLNKYKNISTIKDNIKLDDIAVEITCPEQAEAYDVIPIKYKLIKPPYKAGRVAFEATAFEEPAKVKGASLYDLSIPGNMNVKIDYLGSISAYYQDDKYIPLTADPNTQISPFPPFKRDDVVCSSTIKAADIIWFKFRITNTGDTILDPEGFSGCFVEPFIVKLDELGKGIWKASPVNLFLRFLEYLYPGDSVELWANFNCDKFGQGRLGLESGQYRIDFRLIARFYDQYDWAANIWAGTEFCRLEVPIQVTKEGGNTPIVTTLKKVCTENRMPGYFAKFEEFMTSFNIYPYQLNQSTVEDTIYLQVAPWTKVITLKLISDNPKDIAVARIPIKISQDNLAIKYNPNNTMVINRNGVEEPVFISQSMPAMRTGFQLGPFPEEHMLAFLKEQKDLGVNVIANTCGGWWIPEISGRKEVEMHSACYKYFYDVLVRKLDMKLVGWSVYPPSDPLWYQHAEKLLKKKLTYATQLSGYTSGSEAVTSVDMADPAATEMLAAWINYQYARWGDIWFKTKDNRIQIDIEDTWGWMRDDINIRYGMGQLGLGRFREWLKNKYGTIEKINTVWRSKYTDFQEIDPYANNTVSHSGYSYDKRDSIFYDWNTAISDLDEFRTILRLDMMQKTNDIIRKTIPGAELSVRTEGANLLIKGDGKSDNMHWRHVYYSQRRNAFVYDVIKEKGIVHFYSDYTTLPYTAQEWRTAMKEMVSDGIVPMFLPQFNHMRDILLNPWYGREYQVFYNLEKPSKGIMIHCLMAAYPYWKITYEEGGAPGIIWSDYLCDGFATETQKRELKLLNEQFRTMKRN